MMSPIAPRFRRSNRSTARSTWPGGGVAWLAVVVLLVLAPLGSAQGPVEIPPDSGVSFERITFDFPQFVQPNSDWIRAVINPFQLYDTTGLPSGFLNVHMEHGLVIENAWVSIDIERARMQEAAAPPETVYFNGLPPSPTQPNDLNAFITFSSAPQINLQGGALRSHPVRFHAIDAEGAGTLPTTGVGPPPPVRTEPPPAGPTFSCIQPHVVNIEAARNQCFPMSMANSLQYLETRYELPIPNDHEAGLRGDDSLVGVLDTKSDRSATDRRTGDGVWFVPMLKGKFEYLADNDMEDVIDHSHQGRGYGGVGNEIPDGDFTSSGITSEDKGSTITFDWICEQVKCGADIELVYTRHNDAGEIVGAHAVRIFGCGKTNGRPWLKYAHDGTQSLDNFGLETPEVTIRDIDEDGTLNFGTPGRELSFVMSEKINEKGLEDFNTPHPLVQAFTNGANFVQNELVPGLINTAWGVYNTLTSSKGKALSERLAETDPASLFVPGVKVFVNGRESPVFYGDGNQINFMTPWETESGVASIVIEIDGLPSSVVGMEVSATAPGIFMIDPAAPQPRGVIQNQDFTINASDNGAAAGDRVIAYAAGLGAVTNPVPTGQPALAEPLSHVIGVVTATINGLPATVEFAGLAPGFHGLYQLNLVVPAGLAPGTYALVISVDGVASNEVYLTIN